MLYRIRQLQESCPGADGASAQPQGRFVLHRHCDAGGDHLDLRLEYEGYLAGFRLDATALEDAWATPKLPHPLAWLDEDGPAQREDEGTYAWLEQDGAEGTLLLDGRNGPRLWRVEALRIQPAAVRALLEAMSTCRAAPTECAQLLADGAEARQRAIARLCGLGRELDGNAFDEKLWRKCLAGLSLREVHTQLELFERRFDAKYPPQPVSQPEKLENTRNIAGPHVMEILRAS